MENEINDDNDGSTFSCSLDSDYCQLIEAIMRDRLSGKKPWTYYLVSIGCPIAMLVGVLTNLSVFVVLMRSRLWLKHEGYVYLAANLCANVMFVLFCTSSFWLLVFHNGHYYPPDISNFTCKMWHFFMSVSFFAPGWLSVALLFSVYLREHLTHRRRCGCPIFAAKYCTLFASKIIVGLIIGVLCVCGVPYLAIFEIHDGRCHSNGHMAVFVTFFVEAILMWVLPFVFFLPIILLMTLCTKREGDSFGFSQLNERSASDEQMRAKAATLSAMAFPSHFIFVLLRWTPSQFGYYVHNWIDFIELVYPLSLGLQPIFCFIILKELRDGLRYQLRRISCCHRLFPSLDRDEGVVQLTAIEEDPPSSPEA